MNEAKTIYCSYRDRGVNVRKGMEQCIRDHQCFSDDPCPLDREFKKIAEPHDGNCHESSANSQD